MTNEMNTLVDRLKDAGQDFEFYPTTKEMVKLIWDSRRKPYDDGSGYDIEGFGDVLDIGCGTCNFRRWVQEFNDAEAATGKDRYEVNISTYYVIEKSRILIDKLDASTIVLGTDFRETTLIDKAVKTIFCNPPYSEYVEWTLKILKESVCDDIYMVIPQRWKENEEILLMLKKLNLHFDEQEGFKRFHHGADVEILGSADFLDAERSARAKVDIVHFRKKYINRDSGFDAFFDETFGMADDDPNSKCDFEYQERRAEAEALKAELLTGNDKIEILCNGYAQAQKNLFDHFKVICGLDAGTLKAIGVQKDAVKKALKKNFEGLKNLYWQAAFDCLDEITSRLTTTSRRKLLERFTVLKTVDFTPANIYALLVWVIKNANQYSEQQMVDFFMGLSCAENVKNYVSNQRVFTNDNWRYRNCDWQTEKPSHYTLDYRIVCTSYALPGEVIYDENHFRKDFNGKIQDICTVANNLGFSESTVDMPLDYGKPGKVYTDYRKLGKEELLFEFRCYMNGNVHIKLNIEFTKALNVAVARKLGWIHSAEDIQKEFAPEMAQGAEKYFNAFQPLAIDSAEKFMLPNCGA